MIGTKKESSVSGFAYISVGGAGSFFAALVKNIRRITHTLHIYLTYPEDRSNLHLFMAQIHNSIEVDKCQLSVNDSCNLTTVTGQSMAVFSL